MSITPERKAELIKEYATKSGDTGSPEVQVAILSEKMVSQRRRLLDYTRAKDEERYKSLITSLGIRR